MTLDEVKSKIERIHQWDAKGNFGGAHGLEDDLLQLFVEDVALNPNNPEREKAILIMELLNSNRTRWFA